MKNKIFIIFICIVLLFMLVSCSVFFNSSNNSSKIKVGVGDIILTNGYRIPFEYLENFSYIPQSDVLGIVYNILDVGSYMVICPKPNALLNIWDHNETSWVGCYYDEITESMLPVYDVPYLWEIDTGDSCGIDNWDVIKKQTKQQKSQTDSMLSSRR